MLSNTATQHGVKVNFNDIFVPFAEIALQEEKVKIAAGDVKSLLKRNERETRVAPSAATSVAVHVTPEAAEAGS